TALDLLSASQPGPGDSCIADHNAANPLLLSDFKHNIQLRPGQIRRDFQQQGKNLRLPLAG
ncbi:MAG: hypothetical protein PVG33_06505, partial [Chloroflexota bacterium]